MGPPSRRVTYRRREARAGTGAPCCLAPTRRLKRAAPLPRRCEVAKLHDRARASHDRRARHRAITSARGHVLRMSALERESSDGNRATRQDGTALAIRGVCSLHRRLFRCDAGLFPCSHRSNMHCALRRNARRLTPSIKPSASVVAARGGLCAARVATVVEGSSSLKRHRDIGPVGTPCAEPARAIVADRNARGRLG